MKRLMFGAAIAALTLGPAVGASVSPTKYPGQELAKGAKIALVKARAAAIGARPGRIVDLELEKERGGSGLRYSFDIVSHDKTIEVGIDAMTGKTVESSAENPTKNSTK